MYNNAWSCPSECGLNSLKKYLPKWILKNTKSPRNIFLWRKLNTTSCLVFYHSQTESKSILYINVLPSLFGACCSKFWIILFYVLLLFRTIYLSRLLVFLDHFFGFNAYFTTYWIYCSSSKKIWRWKYYPTSQVHAAVLTGPQIIYFSDEIHPDRSPINIIKQKNLPQRSFGCANLQYRCPYLVPARFPLIQYTTTNLFCCIWTSL